MDIIVNKRKIKFPWKAVGLYLVCILPMFYLLLHYNGGRSDPKTFIDIIHFRLSHHFFASAFGWFNLVLGFIFAWIAVTFYKQRLLWFIILILFGCLVYELGVEYFQFTSILYTQWWKTTIWMESFAFIAISYHLEKSATRLKFLYRYPFLILFGLLLMVSAFRLSDIRPVKPDYMFPWTKKNSAEVDISIKAGEVTAPDALFIVPIEFTAFRWYSKRSTYVDWKAMLHQETFLKDWYARINSIYQYGIPEKEGGFDIHNFSRYLLEDPSSMSIEFWKKLGITHIISTNTGIKGMSPIASNGQFAIYKL